MAPGLETGANDQQFGLCWLMSNQKCGRGEGIELLFHEKEIFESKLLKIAAYYGLTEH